MATSRPLVRLACFGLAGAAMACATPPMNVYPTAWLGMVALAWLLRSESFRLESGPLGRRVLLGSLLGWIFGVGTNLVALRFVATVVLRFEALPGALAPAALFLVAAFEATRWLVAGLVYVVLLRARLPRPAAFAVGVYVGTFVPTMIPWTVACGVCPWPAAVQLAEVVGERGVALLMALESALVADGVWRLTHGERRPGVASLGSAGALVFAMLLYGAVRIGQVDALRMRARSSHVALLTPAIPVVGPFPEDDVDEGPLARLTRLTVQAEASGAELVVWPETSYPFPLPHASREAPDGKKGMVQGGIRGPLLVGLVMADAQSEYNSAVVATADGALSEPYDKIHLMWFGEFVPFAGAFPWLRRVLARPIDFRAGEHAVALEAGAVRAAVLTCLEDILPDAGREAMAVRPNLLVNLTDDGWFEGTQESELHLRLSTLRAVELRRDLVRAVNAGPTTWVDAVGRIVARREGTEAGVLSTQPALLDGAPTAYARFGDVPLLLLVGIGALVAAARRLRGT